MHFLHHFNTFPCENKECWPITFAVVWKHAENLFPFLVWNAYPEIGDGKFTWALWAF